MILKDLEGRDNFESVSGNYSRHHVQRRVKLHVPKGGSFPLPLVYIDAVRRTHTTFDVLLENLTDDRGNVDGDRDLSGPWSGCTRFTRLTKKSQKGHTWSWERLTRVQPTSRPDYSMARSVVRGVKKFQHKENGSTMLVDRGRLSH